MEETAIEQGQLPWLAEECQRVEAKLRGIEYLRIASLIGSITTSIAVIIGTIREEPTRPAMLVAFSMAIYAMIWVANRKETRELTTRIHRGYSQIMEREILMARATINMYPRVESIVRNI